MDDPEAMSLGDGVAGLDQPADRARDRLRAVAVDDGREVAACEELHHDERRAVVGGVDVEDAHGVRAGERPGGTGLALEALDELGILTEGRAEDLDGHALAEPDVTRLEDHAHAALTEDALDGVLPSERRMTSREPRVLVAVIDL